MLQQPGLWSLCKVRAMCLSNMQSVLWGLTGGGRFCGAALADAQDAAAQPAAVAAGSFKEVSQQFWRVRSTGERPRVGHPPHMGAVPARELDLSYAVFRCWSESSASVPYGLTGCLIFVLRTGMPLAVQGCSAQSREQARWCFFYCRPNGHAD